MTYDVAADVRLDPRLKEILARIPVEPAGNVDSREAGSWIAGRRGSQIGQQFANDVGGLLTQPKAPPQLGMAMAGSPGRSGRRDSTIGLRVRVSRWGGAADGRTARA